MLLALWPQRAIVARLLNFFSRCCCWLFDLRHTMQATAAATTAATLNFGCLCAAGVVHSLALSKSSLVSLSFFLFPTFTLCGRAHSMLQPRANLKQRSWMNLRAACHTGLWLKRLQLFSSLRFCSYYCCCSCCYCYSCLSLFLFVPSSFHHIFSLSLSFSFVQSPSTRRPNDKTADKAGAKSLLYICQERERIRERKRFVFFLLLLFFVCCYCCFCCYFTWIDKLK